VLCVETIAKIRLLYHVKKKTVSEIARQVRMSRNTVYKYLHHDMGTSPNIPVSRKRCSNWDPTRPQAKKHWKGIRHPHRLRDLFAGVIFVDGIPANETQPDPQQDAA